MSIDDLLHRDLSQDALEYAKEVRERYAEMTEGERRKAMGLMRVYEHMLNNWERK